MMYIMFASVIKKCEMMYIIATKVFFLSFVTGTLRTKIAEEGVRMIFGTKAPKLETTK